MKLMMSAAQAKLIVEGGWDMKDIRDLEKAVEICSRKENGEETKLFKWVHGLCHPTQKEKLSKLSLDAIEAILGVDKDGYALTNYDIVHLDELLKLESEPEEAAGEPTESKNTKPR